MKNIKQVTVRDFNQNKIKHEAVGQAIGVQASAVGKLEKKRIADVSVARLINYVEAIGGKIAIQVTLPSGEVMKL